jgi:shikimate dehydrogenase
MSERVEILGVAGRPVLHSMSPVLFRELFRITGRRAAYLRVAAVSAEEALILFKALGMRGMNLTAPFKEQSVPLVDELSPDARALGAINCLVPLAGGGVGGRNTDPCGVIGGLAARGVDVRGRRCLVIGAGGAGKSAARALVGSGGDVVIANRTLARAEELAAALGCAASGLDALADLASSADVIASTLAADALPDPSSWFPRGRSVAVVDADYKTGALAAYAARLGLPVSSGADWLVGQGLPAYELFMGEKLPSSPELDLSRLSALLSSSPRAYEKGRKVALVGLMGAGKSSVGAALSSLMGVPFVDSDREIEREAGKTIPEIFASEGESGFRERETRAIDRITSTPGPLVLSAGGGAATREASAAILRDRCLPAWLYVSPKTATLRSGGQRGSGAARPLLAGGDPETKLRVLEEERRGAYASLAEILVSTEGRGARSVAEALHEEIDRLS